MRKKVLKVLTESSSDRKERYNPRYYFHRVTQSKSGSFFNTEKKTRSFNSDRKE